MNEENSVGESETQRLSSRLLDAVKQCQIRFGGRTELATESNSAVSCLCVQFEAVLQHGLRKSCSPPLGGLGLSSSSSTKGTTVLHVRDVMTSLNVNLNLNFKSSDCEPVFWEFVREFLNRHEQERYILLKNVSSDIGRGRAWLRSSLNEHSLERYMHMFLSEPDQLCRFYENWAFMRDQEKSNLLPNMSAGLGSILFAINIDNSDLNLLKTINTTTNNSSPTLTVSRSPQDEPSPVIACLSPADANPKDKRKKKRIPAHQVVSFDEEECTETSGNISLNCGKYSVRRENGSSCDDCQFPENAKYQRQSCSNMDSETVKHTVDPPRCLSFVNDGTLPSLHLEALPSCNAGVIHDNVIDSSSSGGSSYSEDESRSSDVPCDIKVDNVHNLTTSSNNGGSLSRFRLPFLSYSFENHRVSDSHMVDTQTPLTPVNDRSVGELFPVSQVEEVHSEDSVSIPSFSEDVDNAAGATPLPSKTLQSSPHEYAQDCAPATGSDLTKMNKLQELTEGDLRQALVTIMQKKEDLEDQNRSLRALMDKEMEMSAALRIENDELKKKHQDKFDRLQNKLQALSRENELLKHQLRKYVGAVQMLKRDGTQAHEALSGLNRDGQVGGSDGRLYIDYHMEAAEYEKKLIQVAEMHGELMEFNDRLHRLLSQKEFTVRRLKEELVDLRGPLPDDALTSDDDISITSDYDTSSMTAAARALINVWIPSVFLTGKASDVHHVYQVYIRIRDDEWNIYRRYAQFYALHKDLKKKDTIINTFDFPPKKVLGNKDAKFVEERRKRLQHYLRCIVNLMMQNNADLVTNPDKETLTSLMPFFGELANPVNKHRNSRQGHSRHIFSRGLCNLHDSRSAGHYTGL